MTEQEMEALARELSAGWHETDPSPYVAHNQNKLAGHILAAFKRVAAESTTTERHRISDFARKLLKSAHGDEASTLLDVITFAERVPR